MGGPSAQVLTLQIIRAIKLPPNQKRERMTGKKRLKGHGPEHTHSTLGYAVTRVLLLQMTTRLT